MAYHNSPASMLKESLDETLEAAKLCIEFRKDDDRWKPFNSGGCLGYPAAILLFSIVDSVGSYFRKNDSFRINIDGGFQTIDADDWEHFKILNSKYFKQELSSTFIKALYRKFRSSLMHNSVLGKDSIMYKSNSNSPLKNIKDVSFCLGNDESGKDVYMIFIQEFFFLCKNAVEEFKCDIDSVVPASKYGKRFH